MKSNHFLQVWETLQRLLVSKKDIISRIISGGSDSRLPAIVLPLTEQWRVTSQHFIHCSPLNLMKSDSFPKWRLNQFKFSSTSTSKLYTTTSFHFRVVSFVYTRTFQLIALIWRHQIPNPNGIFILLRYKETLYLLKKNKVFLHKFREMSFINLL